MQKQEFDASLPVSAFFQTGKMDTDFIIGERYVTGVCVMYAQRSAQEHEYMIREKSIVALDTRGLSQCVQESKDLAYQAAVSRLGNVNFSPVAEPHKQEVVTPPTAPPRPESRTVTPPPVAQKHPDEDDGEDEYGNEWNDPEGTALPDDAPPEENIDTETMGGAQQFNLNGLRPASSLLAGASKSQPQSSLEEADPAESAYKKARNMRITILGKLHECNNWTAGRILDERPEIIVDFAHRYNGPKVGERDALKMLYTDALRRVNQAA